MHDGLDVVDALHDPDELLRLHQVAVVDVAGEGVLLVQREEPVFQNSLDRGFPVLDQDPWTGRLGSGLTA